MTLTMRVNSYRVTYTAVEHDIPLVCPGCQELLFHTGIEETILEPVRFAKSVGPSWYDDNIEFHTELEFDKADGYSYPILPIVCGQCGYTLAE